MNPLISIVSGTYRRLPSLQRMIASVRDQLPHGIPYEFVLVGVAEDTETADWAQTQPDVVWIEHPKLLGAIKAFGDGAKAASGQYVILANDDIEFHPDSIMTAYLHLETHDICGGVAFADDRNAPGYAEGLKVQTLTMTSPLGIQLAVPYIQVGMLRRWLGDAIGWWGADDPVMGSGAGTYGGDTFLSAGIWAKGYSIDTLKPCSVTDHVVRDGLRDLNHQLEQKNPRAYYKKFPTPPLIAPVPTLPNPQSESLRILYLPIYERFNAVQKANKRGLREALGKVGAVWEVDYCNVAFDLTAIMQQWKPHLILTQLHSADIITPARLARARAVCPESLFLNWNGDVHLDGLTSEPIMNLLRHIDLQLVVNAHALPTYAQAGIRAAYWQIGYESPLGELPEVDSTDVIFLGNCNSPFRQDLERVLLSEASGGDYKLGLYGKNWTAADGECLYDFGRGEALYQHSRIAIGDQFYENTEAFVSNRMIQALGAGVFFLQQRSRNLEHFTGLHDGTHYVSWKDLSDLRGKLRYWLNERQDAERQRIALAGQQFVLEHYTFEAQVRRLFDQLLPKLKQPVAEVEA